MPWQEVTDPNEIAVARQQLSGKGSSNKALPSNPAAARGLTPTAYSKLLGREDSMAAVEQQLDRVEKLYKKNLRGDPTGSGGIFEYLPTPAMREFDDAANLILPLVRPALAAGAKDGDSDRELAVWERVIPKSSAYDSQNEERIRGLRSLIQQTRATTAKRLGADAPNQAKAAPPRAAILFLRNNPNTAAAFDAKYGAGASARYIRGK